MRICSPQLGLSPESILGGEVFDRKILEGLSDAGITIEIIIPNKKIIAPVKKNWVITRIFFTHFPPQFFNLLIIPYLFLIHKTKKIDIIRLHQPQFTGLGAIFLKFFFKNIKIIATYHQFKETRFGFFSKTINNYWDHIICDSQNVERKIIKTYKIAKNNITVVHNGVPKYLKPEVKDPHLSKKLKINNFKVLLFMGLFIDRKNPIFLILVLKELLKHQKNIVLMLLGNGPLKKKIVLKSKELGIENNIRILDPVFGVKKNVIHNLADIFLHPSTDEGFALAPLEAMACGKPIIMNNSHSAKEAIENGRNGFLCKENDLNSWTEKIQLLLNNPKLADKMGNNSLKKSKKEFQWEFSVKKHIEVINNLIYQK